MELKIKREKENPVLERKEMEILVEHNGKATPSENAIRSKLAAERDLENGAIIIEGIYSNFGSSTSKVMVKILENPEDFIELGAEEEKEEEKQKEAKEEVSEEEKKEDVKEEQEDEKSTEEEAPEKEEEKRADRSKEKDEESKKDAEEREMEKEADYEKIVDNSISDAKNELERMQNLDYEKILEAEKDNKDRKTFKEWIKSKMEE